MINPSKFSGLNANQLHKLLTYLISVVWIVNGLYCKVLNMVPRHEAIVAKILELENARTLTVLIGLAEIGMAVWILSKYKSRINAIIQMIVIATMNTLEFLGNIFTHYKYTTTDINQLSDETSRLIESKKSNFRVELGESNETISLPVGSPFSNWKEARMFAGPLPFTFSCSKKNDSVLIIEGVRENWTPIPLQVKDYYFNFLETLPIQDPILANAFEIKNIPYFWKKGKIEKWT